MAQGIKGIGSAGSSYLVGVVATIAVFQQMGWRGSFPVFFALMAAAFIWVATLRIDEAKADIPPSIATSLGLLKRPVFMLAVIGIFLYVGAEACMGRFLPPLLREMGVPEETAAKIGPAFFFLLLTIGRLGGGAILKVMSARTCFRLSALLGLVGSLILMFGGSSLAVVGVVAAGLGFASIWPMLFSITVEEEPERASELSGLMCMAISGGAIIPLLMGGLVDAGFKTWAFVVPAACFAYLSVLSLRGESQSAAASP